MNLEQEIQAAADAAIEQFEKTEGPLALEVTEAGRLLLDKYALPAIYALLKSKGLVP